MRGLLAAGSRALNADNGGSNPSPAADGRSSSGRTLGFEPGNAGSNPARPAGTVMLQGREANRHVPASVPTARGLTSKGRGADLRGARRARLICGAAIRAAAWHLADPSAAILDRRGQWISDEAWAARQRLGRSASGVAVAIASAAGVRLNYSASGGAAGSAGATRRGCSAARAACVATGTRSEARMGLKVFGLRPASGEHQAKNRASHEYHPLL
jgi:hypothetical protein